MGNSQKANEPARGNNEAVSDAERRAAQNNSDGPESRESAVGPNAQQNPAPEGAVSTNDAGAFEGRELGAPTTRSQTFVSRTENASTQNNAPPDSTEGEGREGAAAVDTAARSVRNPPVGLRSTRRNHYVLNGNEWVRSDRTGGSQPRLSTTPEREHPVNSPNAGASASASAGTRSPGERRGRARVAAASAAFTGKCDKCDRPFSNLTQFLREHTGRDSCYQSVNLVSDFLRRQRSLGRSVLSGCNECGAVFLIRYRSTHRCIVNAAQQDVDAAHGMGGTRCKYMATVTPYGIHTPTPEEMDLEMDQQDDAEFTANVLEAFRLCAGLEGSDKLPFLRDVELIFRALVVEATSLGEGAKGERLQALATLGWACVSGVAQRCEQRHHKRAFRGVVDGIMQDAAGRRKYGLGRLFYHGILRPYVEAMLRPESGPPVKRWLKGDDLYAHHSGPRKVNVDAVARVKGLGRSLKHARAVRDAERSDTMAPTRTVHEVVETVNAKYPTNGSALTSWTERPLIPRAETQVDWVTLHQRLVTEGVDAGDAATRVSQMKDTFGEKAAEVDEEAALRRASVDASSGASSETNTLLKH